MSEMPPNAASFCRVPAVALSGPRPGSPARKRVQLRNDTSVWQQRFLPLPSNNALLIFWNVSRLRFAGPPCYLLEVNSTKLLVTVGFKILEFYCFNFNFSVFERWPENLNSKQTAFLVQFLTAQISCSVHRDRPCIFTPAMCRRGPFADDPVSTLAQHLILRRSRGSRRLAAPPVIPRIPEDHRRCSSAIRRRTQNVQPASQWQTSSDSDAFLAFVYST